MRVRVLVSIAGTPTYAVGDEVSLPDDVAAAWLREGYVAAIETGEAMRPVETAVAAGGGRRRR